MAVLSSAVPGTARPGLTVPGLLVQAGAGVNATSAPSVLDRVTSSPTVSDG